MPKKIYIRTFGCQMNVRDSEVICGLLRQEGYKLTDCRDKADIILYNTCSVRQHAEDRVCSELGKYKVVPPKFAEANLSRGETRPKKKIIGLVGCMAQSYKDEVFRRAAQVDFVVGTKDIGKIPQIIRDLTKEKWGQSPKGGDSPHFLLERKIWETDGLNRPEEIYRTGFHLDKEHAFAVISEGCSNFCSYCVVPYVRGALRNRNYKDILKEIEEAVDKGITKITLLGQNVNAYQYNGVDFVKLLGLVNLIEELKEFGFITSHPKDTSVDLFKTMQESEKLKKYLHLPVQSGSDRILRAMNRGYTREFYLDLARKYRKMVKGGSLTTDIIVGFPGETEEDFQETYNLVKDVRPDAAYIFKYSPRPHTQAEGLIDDVARQEKERRHRIILELQKRISKKKKC